MIRMKAQWFIHLRCFSVHWLGSKSAEMTWNERGSFFASLQTNCACFFEECGLSNFLQQIPTWLYYKLHICSSIRLNETKTVQRQDDFNPIIIYHKCVICSRVLIENNKCCFQFLYFFIWHSTNITLLCLWRSGCFYSHFRSTLSHCERFSQTQQLLISTANISQLNRERETQRNMVSI